MKLLVANWKMNVSPKEAVRLSRMIMHVRKAIKTSYRIVLCPSAESLTLVHAEIKGSAHIQLGAQNCSTLSRGALTGEVSAASLKDVGCQYVLIGHSERRTQFGEQAAEEGKALERKIVQALKARLKPILCIGENEMERKRGKTRAVLTEQLTSALAGVLQTPAQNLPPSHGSVRSILIAYEPVWAIGSGTPLDALTFMAAKKVIQDSVQRLTNEALPVLYGGSVNPVNISSMFAASDGVLVGTASQSISSFSNLLTSL